MDEKIIKNKNLTAIQKGRLLKVLNKSHHYSVTGEIFHLWELFLHKDFVKTYSKYDHPFEWNRTKFNRMYDREQREYEKRYENLKEFYYIEFKNNKFWEIPKIVFDNCIKTWLDII